MGQMMAGENDADEDKSKGKLKALFQVALREPRLTAILVVGVLCVLLSYAAAVSLDHMREHIHYPPGSDAMFWWGRIFIVIHAFEVVMRDAGFAFLIAFILGMLVERVARQEQAALVKNAIHQIQENVLESTYSVRTPNSIVKLILQDILSAQIVRDSYSVNYVLSPLDGQKEFVVLKVEIDSVIRNVGTEPKLHKIRLNLPLRVDEEFRNISKLLGGTIGTESLDDKLIKDGDAKVEDSDYEHNYLWERMIDPDKTLRVMFSFNLVKEKSSNEVWTSLLPCERLEISVKSECPDIEWNVDPLFSGELNPLDGDRKGPHKSRPVPIRYSATTPLLPHQGIVLWWRKGGSDKPVEAADAVEAQH